jgi:hypothetical protein
MLGVLVPIVGLWVAVTGLVTVAMIRLTDTVRAGSPPRLPPEAWGVAAASGAAGGGLVGLSAAAPSLAAGAAPGVLAAALAVTAAAMVVGAALAAGLLLLAVWLWTGGA